MAYSLNRSQLIGNLTMDPEVRQIPSGKAVATFNIATNMSWTDQNGQKQDKAEFHSIVIWGKLAEIAGQYLKKGRKIYVEGRLQTRNWTGEDGIKRYKTEIIAENFIILDKAGDSTGNYTPSSISETPRQINNPSPQSHNSAPMPDIQEEEITLDDLPF
jgi:single-strand DNA-binding protein